MNAELKLLTKKIRLLNEIMCLGAFYEKRKFGQLQTKAQADAYEIFHSRIDTYRPSLLSKVQTIQRTASLYRELLGNVSVYLEKTIKDDKLATITLIETKTGTKLPLDVNQFIEQLDTIKIETAKGTRRYA